MFKLGEVKPEQKDGVTFFYHNKRDVDDNEFVTIHVVDDKSAPGDTLAKRRIRLMQRDVQLYRIRYAVYFLGDLVKIAKPKTWFIDSLGKIFQYEKSTRAELIFMRISQILPLATGGAVIEVDGLATRFKTLFMPSSDSTYAGILKFGKSLILYGVYDQPYKNSWRKV